MPEQDISQAAIKKAELKKRNYEKTLAEFKETEESFNQDLLVICQIDIEKLRVSYENAKDAHSLTPCKGIEAMIKAAKDLQVAQALFNQKVQNEPMENWGDAYQAYADAYLNYQAVSDTYAPGISGVKLPEEFSQAFRQNNKGLGPDSFFIKPVQRFTKLPLLARELNENSAEDNPDLPAIKDLKSQFEDTLDYLNNQQSVEVATNLQLNHAVQASKKSKISEITSILAEFEKLMAKSKASALDTQTETKLNTISTHPAFNELLDGLSKSEIRKINRALKKQKANLPGLDDIRKHLQSQARAAQYQQQLISDSKLQGAPKTDYGELSAKRLEAVQLLSGLKGQKSKSDCFELVNASQDPLISEFFEIQNRYSGAYTPRELLQYGVELQAYFKKHGFDLGELANLDDYSKLNGKLDGNLDNQLLLYFMADIKSNFDISEKGYLSRYDDQLPEQSLNSMYSALEDSGFTLTTRDKAGLLMNDENSLEILLQGALKGDTECQTSIATIHLSYMINDINSAESVKPPNGVSMDDIKSWLKQVQETGHVIGLSKINNFLDNVLQIVGNVHDANRSEGSKQKLLETINLAKEVSGDPKFCQYLDDMLSLSPESPTFRADLKALRNEASKYLVDDYHHKNSISLAKVIDLGNQGLIPLNSQGKPIGEQKYDALMKLLTQQPQSNNLKREYAAFAQDKDLSGYLEENPSKQKELTDTVDSIPALQTAAPAQAAPAEAAPPEAAPATDAEVTATWAEVDAIVDDVLAAASAKPAQYKMAQAEDPFSEFDELKDDLEEPAHEQQTIDMDKLDMDELDQIAAFDGEFDPSDLKAAARRRKTDGDMDDLLKSLSEAEPGEQTIDKIAEAIPAVPPRKDPTVEPKPTWQPAAKPSDERQPAIMGTDRAPRTEAQASGPSAESAKPPRPDGPPPGWKPPRPAGPPPGREPIGADAPASPSDLPPPPSQEASPMAVPSDDEVLSAALPPPIVHLDGPEISQFKAEMETLKVQCNHLIKQSNTSGGVFNSNSGSMFVGYRGDQINYRQEKCNLLEQVNAALDKMMKALEPGPLTTKDYEAFTTTMTELDQQNQILENLNNSINKQNPMNEVLNLARNMVDNHVGNKIETPKASGPSGMEKPR